ncbi:MAG: cyclase family protein [Rubrivivax sp.]|nr:cyclase family protein [Rubrivivax sp.]
MSLSTLLPHGPRPRCSTLALAATGVLLAASIGARADEPAPLLASAAKRVPDVPWPAGDQKGMGNTQGPGTWARCAWHMGRPGAKSYELSWERTKTMPLSPFVAPLVVKPKPVAGIPGTAHAFNGETLNEGAEPGQQGTQLDALGHFGMLKQPWDGKPPFPTGDVVYYGGLSAAEVKPSADSPLLKLGIEQIPPIVTTAVLLDAKRHANGGQPMKAGEVVTAAQIKKILAAQGLARRGLQPGDVVYVYTGWSDRYKDPDTEKTYYAMAPGLAYDAAQMLGAARVVAVGVDAPFVDSVPEGMLAGKAGPAPGALPGLPFSVHHHLLTQVGIVQVENARLHELAADRVYTSCTMILPTRERGAAGAAVRPVAIGAATKGR